MDTRRAWKHPAFVSYSHADRQWGEWLQRSLENYAVPGDLVGKTTPKGPVPETLRPVFRDRWDLAAGHALDEQIEAALEQSGHLIVICSPNSAKSPYVNEEIWRFKAKGREKRILALIVGGRPGDPERECFPEALQCDRTPGGAVARSLHTPLAADARPEGDGRELAKLKVVAGILGVPLDDIRKRAEIEQRRQLRRARMIAASMAALALLAVACAGAAFWAYGERGVALKLAEERKIEAERRYDQALDQTLRFITTSATFRALLDPGTKFGDAERTGKLESDDFRDFIENAKNPEEVWLRLVRLLKGYVEDPPSALRRFHRRIEDDKIPLQWIEHAETIMGNLIRRHGGNPEYKAELAAIRGEIARLGGTPREDCPETEPAPAGNDLALNRMANAPANAPMTQMAQESPVQMRLSTPCN